MEIPQGLLETLMTIDFFFYLRNILYSLCLLVILIDSKGQHSFSWLRDMSIPESGDL